MSQARYQPPVDKLLTYGQATLGEWPDYARQLGLGPEHVSELIRMATDDALHHAGTESVEVWAPTHAWRALGQLQAEAAIEPLIGLFPLHVEDDWVTQEVPEALGMIGPAAIPALAAFLADASHGVFERTLAATSLGEVGKRHTDAWAECITALARQLEQFEGQDPELNAFLINYLMDLRAVETAPLMERAFAASKVDVTICGDWEDVQIELGLRAVRETPRPYRELYWKEMGLGQPPAGQEAAPLQVPASQAKARPGAKVKAKAKANREGARKSRKLARKR